MVGLEYLSSLVPSLVSWTWPVPSPRDIHTLWFLMKTSVPGAVTAGPAELDDSAVPAVAAPPAATSPVAASARLERRTTTVRSGRYIGNSWSEAKADGLSGSCSRSAPLERYPHQVDTLVNFVMTRPSLSGVRASREPRRREPRTSRRRARRDPQRRTCPGGDRPGPSGGRSAPSGTPACRLARRG